MLVTFSNIETQRNSKTSTDFSEARQLAFQEDLQGFLIEQQAITLAKVYVSSMKLQEVVNGLFTELQDKGWLDVQVGIIRLVVITGILTKPFTNMTIAAIKLI